MLQRSGRSPSETIIPAERITPLMEKLEERKLILDAHGLIQYANQRKLRLA